jgi:hypothetical protein
MEFRGPGKESRYADLAVIMRKFSFVHALDRQPNYFMEETLRRLNACYCCPKTFIP